MNVEPGQALWVREWAERIHDHQLSLAALPLLELARSLNVVAGHAFLAVEPMLAGIVHDTTIERARALLDRPDLLDLLEANLAEEGS